MRNNNISSSNAFILRTNSPVAENSNDRQNIKFSKDNIFNYHNVYVNNNNTHNLNNSSINNINDSVTTLNGSPSQYELASSRLQSESPEPELHHQNNRQGDDNSPVDSSRSFPVSQKSGEEACGQISPVDSLGSRSPENLSSRKYEFSSSSSTAGNIFPDMLDHKLPLSFLGPPLAALHSMTEMKSPGGSPLINSNNNAGNMGVIGNTGIGTGQTTGHNLHSGTANPHGIDTILSRPPPVTSTGLSALTGGGMPRFSIAAAAAGMAQYLSQSQSAPLKAHAGHLVDRPHLYWPGLQGLVANPMAWRDRLTNSMSANLSQSHHNSDKDGKKKHTRPTFSGQQIFALEKTFEQTKYLAGPERAKLAYALGMTESQVKVWFQNRRTKWRKKHAAEMATAKRKQEELGDGDGDCSEAIESDSESLDLGESGRKRCRMDDNLRHQ